MTIAYLGSPIGILTLRATDAGLAGVTMEDHLRGPDSSPEWVENPGHPILAQARQELTEYFRGTRRTFSVPLAPEGTPFQHSVWERLRAIPYGATTTYGAIAAELGMNNGARAVGLANGANPISIIVPCHRVVGANGMLTGFAGGIERKRWLLDHEGGLFGADSPLSSHTVRHDPDRADHR